MNALSNTEALELVQGFLAMNSVREIEELRDVFSIWLELAGSEKASPKIWMDAYLAAIAIAHGLRFVTLDKGFSAFESKGLHLLLLRSD